MHELITIDAVKEVQNGTQLIITIPNRKLQQMLIDKRVNTAELRLDDGRIISTEQRKKAYATIRDIADYTGNPPELQKEDLEFMYIAHTGRDYFSLSDCTMDEAREFINFLIELDVYKRQGSSSTSFSIFLPSSINSLCFSSFIVVHQCIP